MIAGCLFDLDGVIVDTARYHFQAWHELAEELGFDFTEEEGEKTKGVSRMASLDIVLRVGGMERRFSDEEKVRLADRKNTRYRQLIGAMTPDEILPGVVDFLTDVRRHGVKVVLGSASKNAGVILDRCKLRELFDEVVDGTEVTHAKPDPEVFLRGAEKARVAPAECVVFEDAEAGIEAATRAGMRSVGVGMSDKLRHASMQIATFEGLTFEKLQKNLDGYGIHQNG